MSIEERVAKLEAQVAALQEQVRELMADPIAAETRRLNAAAENVLRDVRK